MVEERQEREDTNGHHEFHDLTVIEVLPEIPDHRGVNLIVDHRVGKRERYLLVRRKFTYLACQDGLELVWRAPKGLRQMDAVR